MLGREVRKIIFKLNLQSAGTLIACLRFTLSSLTSFRFVFRFCQETNPGKSILVLNKLIYVIDLTKIRNTS